ncbi:class II fructose-bisphosphate aldolase [Pararhizobium sp. IMCC21322]|uniref:class II fructose-bisphosphate aldolase n=1 Tax=Pararhizobium sp. IMCC21322 TaxID=3067903 RepID=UPI0027425AFD|nr:class II fructose-bisphosphate aldolase [Pararhizobium sp. IMCC21322]
MTIATLTDVLQPAMANGYAIGGLVVLGWEDAKAYVEAAEETGMPVILQAGPGCRAYTPMPILGKMFRHLAEQASIPVVCHLDHGYKREECFEAIDCGFTSVMFDGSKLPLSENIDKTASIAEKAHAAGVSLEGEVGYVGYADGPASAGTTPEEAERFDRESGADAMAISIGNVHLQTEKSAGIDFAALRAIEAVTRLPLVLHGGSGIPTDIRRKLASESRVSKFNIGTELRMAFGSALRETLAANPDSYDRVALLKPTIAPVRQVAAKVLTGIGPLS